MRTRRDGWVPVLLVFVPDQCPVQTLRPHGVICAQDPPDHTQIARFRQRHLDLFTNLFTQVLIVCTRLGYVRLGIVAIELGRGQPDDGQVTSLQVSNDRQPQPAQAVNCSRSRSRRAMRSSTASRQHLEARCQNARVGAMPSGRNARTSLI